MVSKNVPKNRIPLKDSMTERNSHLADFLIEGIPGCESPLFKKVDGIIIIIIIRVLYPKMMSCSA